MIQNEKLSRCLRTQLTPAELAEQAKIAARTVGEIARLEDDAKETAASYKARIQEKRNIITEASKKVDNEYEYRDVQCERVFDRATQQVCVYRCDTGEMLESREFTESEKQLTLEEAEAEAESEENDAADEIFPVEDGEGNEPSGALIGGEEF